MSTLNGLPVHILLVHLIVVLVPLTAISVTLSALWPSVRQRLVWPTVFFAVVVVILTPITTEAGEWLEQFIGENPHLQNHIQLGETFLYFAVPLLIAAVLVAIMHVRLARGHTVSRLIIGAVAVVAIAASVAASVQVYRIGESGSRAVWGGVGTQSAS
ncbi:DUF2231 domain-containing protein [Nocardia altamirensis]|uniref:DUF2231 domain-containing protein n=1 Tax=Nocardia altamirensis TaxID=472158 RepID=UPI0008400DB9|nr:DUF2231 domain-containing protein [Nocardia altamirensis]